MGQYWILTYPQLFRPPSLVQQRTPHRQQNHIKIGMHRDKRHPGHRWWIKSWPMEIKQPMERKIWTILQYFSTFERYSIKEERKKPTICGTTMASNAFFRPNWSANHPASIVPARPPMPIIEQTHAISSIGIRPDGNGQSSESYNKTAVAIQPTDKL